MKKYPFPPGVTSMMPPAYEEHCNREAAKEREAKAARKARAARREEARATGPVARITALAVGASVTFPDYVRTTQVSSAMKAVYVNEGRKFTSRIARSLIDGESVIGVTVTRTE